MKAKKRKKIIYIMVIFVVFLILTDLIPRTYTWIKHDTAFWHTDKFYLEFHGREVAEYHPVNPFLVLQPYTHSPNDKDGYRGKHSIRDPKKQGDVRVFCLGGSTTHNLAAEKCYPENIEDKINASLKGKYKLRVFNAARGGWSSNHSIVRAATEVAHLKPDIITILHGTNDMSELCFKNINDYYFVRDPKYFHNQYFSFLRAAKIEGGLYEAVVYNKMLNQHKLLNIYFSKSSYYGRFDKSEESAYPEELVLRGLKEYETNLKTLSGIAKSCGAELIIFSQPLNLPGEHIHQFGNERLGYGLKHPTYKDYLKLHDRYTSVTRSVSKEVGATFIDVKQHFIKLGNVKDLFVDLVHQNDSGTKKFAEVVENEFLEVVENRISKIKRKHKSNKQGVIVN